MCGRDAFSIMPPLPPSLLLHPTRQPFFLICSLFSSVMNDIVDRFPVTGRDVLEWSMCSIGRETRLCHSNVSIFFYKILLFFKSCIIWIKITWKKISSKDSISPLVLYEGISVKSSVVCRMKIMPPNVNKMLKKRIPCDGSGCSWVVEALDRREKLVFVIQMHAFFMMKFRSFLGRVWRSK